MQRKLPFLHCRYLSLTVPDGSHGMWFRGPGFDEYDWDENETIEWEDDNETVKQGDRVGCTIRINSV